MKNERGSNYPGGFDAFDERVSLANSYIVGYAKDLITDEECNDMIDLALNKISIVNGEGIIWQDAYDEEEFISAWTQEDCNEFIEVGCSAALDNEWANESI